MINAIYIIKKFFNSLQYFLSCIFIRIYWNIAIAPIEFAFLILYDTGWRRFAAVAARFYRIMMRFYVSCKNCIIIVLRDVFLVDSCSESIL